MLTLNNFAKKWLEERGYLNDDLGFVLRNMAENVLHMLKQSGLGVDPQHSYELMLMRNIVRDYEEGKSWKFDKEEMYRCMMCGKKYTQIDSHMYKFSCKCPGNEKIRISIG